MSTLRINMKYTKQELKEAAINATPTEAMYYLLHYTSTADGPPLITLSTEYGPCIDSTVYDNAGLYRWCKTIDPNAMVNMSVKNLTRVLAPTVERNKQ